MTKTFLLFWLSIFLTFVSCTESVNQSESLSQEDKDAISELRNNVIAAIKAGDAKAYGQLCSDSVRLMHPGAPIVNGREKLIEHNAAIFEAVKVTTLILTPVDLYGVGDLAYEVGIQSVQIDPPLEGFSSSRKYLHIMRKSDDDKWRFEALMSSDN